MVGHLSPARVPLTEPLPYGTTGAKFQEIVALGNWGLPVIVVPGLGADAEVAWALRDEDHCPFVCPAGALAPCAFMHWEK